LSDEVLNAKNEKYSEVYKHPWQPPKSGKTVKNKDQRIQANQKKAEENKEKDQEKNLSFNLTIPDNFLIKLKSLNLNVEKLFPENFKDTKGYHKEFLSEAFKQYKNALRALKGWVNIFGFDMGDLNKVETLGLTSPVQLMALHF